MKSISARHVHMSSTSASCMSVTGWMPFCASLRRGGMTRARRQQLYFSLTSQTSKLKKITSLGAGSFEALEPGVVSRSAKWGGPYLGGSSWNRPQRPNPGHLRDCWGCLGRFLGRLGHRTTAIVSTRGVGKSLEFRPGAPRDFF